MTVSSHAREKVGATIDDPILVTGYSADRSMQRASRGLRLTNRLPREGVDQPGDFVSANLVLTEDSLAHTDAILASGRPVKLLHTSITDEGGVQGREIVTSHNDRDTGDLDLVVPAQP